MRDAVTQNRRRKERAKLWIFREMETVATCSTTNGSCHGLALSFFNDMTRRRRQNLAGNDQATLMVDRKSAIYVCYVSEIATNAPLTAAADGGFR